MAKKRVVSKPNDQQMQMLYMNVLRTQGRVSSLLSLLNPGLDIDYECRYPKSIESSQCRKLFNRNGVARRVVTLWPDEDRKSVV